MFYASENCIQELLSASDSKSVNNDGWKILGIDNGVEISKRRSGSLHTFRSRWLLKSVSPQQFITVANAIDAARVSNNLIYSDILLYYIQVLLQKMTVIVMYFFFLNGLDFLFFFC